MRMKSISAVISLLLIMTVIESCRKETPFFKTTEQYSAEVANKWFDQIRTLIKATPGYTPPVAARTLGYAGVALYESVVPGMVLYQSLTGQLNDLNNLPKADPNLEYHWPAAANAALAEISRQFFPTAPNANKIEIENLEAELSGLYAPEAEPEVLERSIAFGKNMAIAISNWSKSDGGDQGWTNNFPADYEPPVGEGFWVPTFPAFQPALQPYWGDNRSFVPDNTLHSQPPTPTAFSTDPVSQFYASALEVYSTVQNLSPEEEIIARYWSDDPGIPGTPPGHSFSIATQVLRKEDASLTLAAETYCKLGIAVNDAFISCWKCKYVFNLMRPITYIQENIDPDWVSILVTPPFPEYTSGHSVQSGATATILSEMFGYQYAFTDFTHIGRSDINGSPRSFNSFNDFAAEAAISRLYGGIHYREAIELGIAQGNLIGQHVNALKFR